MRKKEEKIGVLRTFVVSVCLKIWRYIMPQNCNNHTDYWPTKHHKGHRASFAAVTWEGSGEAVNEKWRKYELALKCHLCSLMEIISINLWKKSVHRFWNHANRSIPFTIAVISLWLLTLLSVEHASVCMSETDAIGVTKTCHHL